MFELVDHTLFKTCLERDMTQQTALLNKNLAHHTELVFNFACGLLQASFINHDLSNDYDLSAVQEAFNADMDHSVDGNGGGYSNFHKFCPDSGAFKHFICNLSLFKNIFERCSNIKISRDTIAPKQIHKEKHPLAS